MTARDEFSLAKRLANAPSAWLPDVFAALYDLLAARGRALDIPAATLGAIPASFERNHFRALLHLQDETLGDLTPDLRLELREALDELTLNDDTASPHWTIVLNTARLIDRVFRGLTLANDSREFLMHYRAHLTSQHLLVRDAEVGGFVLPRAAAPLPKPKSVADLFLYLMRAPATPLYELDYKLLTRSDGGTNLSPLKIGFVPLVHNIDDLDWPVHGSTYAVEVPGTTETELLKELPGILDWLLKHEADFVLMPELVSTPAIVNAIGRWRARQPAGRPYLILAGSHLHRESGPAKKVRNRAVVLGQDGRVLWQQDKLHSYTFSIAHQQAAQWDKCVPPRDLEEGIHVAPWRIVLRDLNGSRFLVAICEDFARNSPHQNVILQFGATHVFVPIMNPERASGDWVHRYGVTLAQDPGTMSLVANSGTLVRRNPTALDDYSALVHPTRRTVTTIKDWRLTPGGPLVAVVREL
jgi:hypothetical protein